MRIKSILLPVLILLCTGCSSNKSDSEPEIKNEYNVELADIYGTWTVNSSSQANLKDIRLVLDSHKTCTWDDHVGNAYVGPYYFLENISDERLSDIGSKIAVENLDRIHISEIKVIGHLSGSVATLEIVCDLYPFLSSPDWVDFNEKIDRREWSFWRFNIFRYEFDITKYSADRLELSLRSSDIYYCDYPEKYPLRILEGAKLVLTRQ